MIRQAEAADLDFLVETDLLGEGYADSQEDGWPLQGPTQHERMAHRAKIAAYVAGGDEMAWVCVDNQGAPLGMIMARYRDLNREPDSEANAFLLQYLDRSLFPADGRFCEVFNLWVNPVWRRNGVATCLKRVIEDEAKRLGMGMMYTHTESANPHVIELNLKLGYQIVRVGPIWDEIERTSLVKWL